MTIKRILFWLFFLNIYQIKCQESVENIIKLLKNYELDNAEITIHNSQLNLDIKNAFLFDIKYLKSGKIDNTYITEILEKSIKESIIENYSIAQYYNVQKTPKDSLVFVHLKQAFINAQNNNTHVFINEALKRIMFHCFKNGKDNTLFEEYIDLADRYKKDSTDYFWVSYFKIASLLQKKQNEELLIADKEKIEKEFIEGIKFATLPYQLGMIKNFEGIYNDGFLKNYDLAIKNYDDAIKAFSKTKYFYSQSKISNIVYNKNLILFEEGKYIELIKIIENDIKIKDTMSTSLALEYKMESYQWISKCYEKLEEYNKAYLYSNRKDSVNKILDEIESAKNIREISKKYNFEKKEKELATLAKKNSKLKTNIMALAPILGFTTLILILIFYLYKRYKKKSSILEEEQSETLQKLDELKNIVIKNHIILKDKTKVYISDLMYIKSDDHYLEVFMQDEKSHLVRGKLSQIKEELPPNFIQCHRSYIVNSNFIKQVGSTTIILINKEYIPLSRSFKKKF